MTESKQAIVRFPSYQWTNPEEEPPETVEEAPIEFGGLYRGFKSGRIHVHLEPPLDRGFLDKKAEVIIPQAFNKQYRAVYVGDDEDGNAVFDQVNRVGGGSLSVED
ncbi:MAG: hypothetical protein ABEK50_16085 [bacterium]